jgi:hypothetical protein
LHERIVAIVAVESRADGSLAMLARPLQDDDRFFVEQATVAITIWCEGDDVVRMSVTDGATGEVAYLQGGAPLLHLAKELGLRQTTQERS